jgi:hypothetical protein
MLVDLAASVDPTVLLTRAGLEPDEWQCEALRCDDSRVLFNVCRQGGKSSVGAALAVHETNYRKRSSLVLLVAPVLRQAGELFGKAMQFHRAAGKPVPLKSEATLKAEFTNGSRIICVPADAESIVGYTADLIIFDEAARIPDSVYHYLRPTVAVTGGRIFGMSTPSGVDGWFAKAWLDEDGWRKFHVTADKCSRISPEFLIQEKKALGSYIYEQEYNGAFHDASGIPGFISYDDYTACMAIDYRSKEWWEAQPLDIGLDVARSPEGDSTAFAAAKGNMLLWVKEYPGARTTETSGKAIEFIKKYSPRSMRVDDANAGGGVVDTLYEEQEKPGADHALKACEIIPVNFGSKADDNSRFFDWRTESWWLTGQAIENRKLGLPKDAKLFQQLTAPAMLRARDGRIKLESKDSLRARRIKSPDLGDAAVLALYPIEMFSGSGGW